MRRIYSLLLATAILFPLSVAGQEAWLVTYGPGEEVWERFGHNALWIRDEERGLDHAFSFGYFEIDRPGFHLDFARGIMRYFGSASAIEREFAFYRGRDRNITAQRLNLDEQQVRHLHRLLHNAIFPVPQYYDYDYYHANCSTWLRDLIDEVLDGQLQSQWPAREANQNFRQHTRRMNLDRPWLHTGLMLILGSRIDQPRSAWEEAFLPDALEHWVAETRIDGMPLAVETREIYASDTHVPPSEPHGLWLFYGGLGLISIALILLPLRFGNAWWARLPWQLAVLALGLGGGVIMLMWFATTHEVVRGNLWLFVLHPLWLLLLFRLPDGLRLVVWWILAAAVAAGAILLAVPGGPQYRADLLLWLVPAAVACLWVARRAPPAVSVTSHRQQN